jgi:ubiquinone biosynthesis protein UbiJ
VRLTVEELLESVRWTLRERVVPGIDDSLQQSYLRSIDGLLVQALQRLRNEPAALAEEIADLRAVLPQLAANSKNIESETPELPRVTVERLRAELVRLMPGLPDHRQSILREYLSRQLARDERVLPALSGMA